MLEEQKLSCFIQALRGSSGEVDGYVRRTFGWWWVLPRWPFFGLDGGSWKIFLIDNLTQETECLGQLVLHVHKNWGVTFTRPIHCLAIWESWNFVVLSMCLGLMDA